MNQNPNNSPYGANPPDSSYPPIPATEYAGGQSPAAGSHSGYSQYAPPSSGPGNPPNSNYGSYAPPPPLISTPAPLVNPYDQAVFSQGGSSAYPMYPVPSSPDLSTSPTPPPPPPVKKHFARTTFMLVFALLVVVGGVLGVVFYTNHQTATQNVNSTATAQARSTDTAQTHASATANAQATAASIKARYPFSANLVLDDPLKDQSGIAKYGWDLGQGCDFANGAYEATEAHANLILPCFAETTHFSNFTFEIQMSIRTGGIDATGGVLFRASSSTAQEYMFLLDPQGNYELDVRANGGTNGSGILKSGKMAGYATGLYQIHTIGVVANGPDITIYVDQHQVMKVSDPSFTSGQIGVFSLYGESATTIAYTNAKVWQL